MWTTKRYPTLHQHEGEQMMIDMSEPCSESYSLDANRHDLKKKKKVPEATVAEKWLTILS